MTPRLLCTPRGGARWLAAGLLAAALAACGGDDDGAAVAPAANGWLLVANADGTVNTCTVTATGDLTVCRTQDVAELRAPASVEVRGEHAYFANAGDHTIAVCRVAATGVDACRVVQDEALSAPTGLAASASSLYAANEDGSIAQCRLGQDGMLGACVLAAPAGTFDSPAGTALSGNTLLVADQPDDAVSVCALTDGGALGACTLDDGGGAFGMPTGMAVSDARLYVTNLDDNSVTTCRLAQGAALADCARTQVDGEFDRPLDVAVNGTRAYVANLGSHALAVCRVTGEGALQDCDAGSAGQAFLNPTAVAFVPAQR